MPGRVFLFTSRSTYTFHFRFLAHGVGHWLFSSGSTTVLTKHVPPCSGAAAGETLRGRAGRRSPFLLIPKRGVGGDFFQAGSLGRAVVLDRGRRALLRKARGSFFVQLLAVRRLFLNRGPSGYSRFAIKGKLRHQGRARTPFFVHHQPAGPRFMYRFQKYRPTAQKNASAHGDATVGAVVPASRSKPLRAGGDGRAFQLIDPSRSGSRPRLRSERMGFCACRPWRKEPICPFFKTVSSISLKLCKSRRS